MVIDISVILVFVVSFWIGWTIRIAIDWIGLVWVALMVVLVTVLVPFFVSFVDQSSANISPMAYYVFGIVTIMLIFICFYLLTNKTKSSSAGLKRLVGTLVLATVSTYSYIIVVASFVHFGWMDIGQNWIFENLPHWMMRPIK